MDLIHAIPVGVIAVGIGGALSPFSDQIETALQNVSNQIAGLPGLGGSPSPPSNPPPSP